MPAWLKIYLISAAVMLPIDAVWLKLSAEPLYRARIGHLLRDGFAPTPAVIFYFLYLVGVLVLAQLPAANWQGAAWRGAVLGLVAYGTYDLTNQATMRDWSTLVTIVDLAWGTVLTATVAGLGHWLGATKLG